jgi:hypothetical protein
LGLVLCLPTVASGEWYVGGQAGVTFADQLLNIEGTNGLFGLRAPDFDLKNSIMYGAKVGNFPANGWFGFEGEVFHTTPHVKNLDEIPGFHLRVTTVAINLIGRYPGASIQPYAGVGMALLIAHMSDSATTRSDSDVGPAFNGLAGVRFFITPYVALFTEYKFQRGSLQFDDAFAVGGFRGDYQAQYIVGGITYHF